MTVPGYAYQLPPIDWWSGWQELHVPPARPTGRLDDEDVATAHHVFNCFDTARRVFTAMGWEGDGQWWMSGLPPREYYNDSALVIAVKQSNNGTTFVFSEVPLNYLDEGPEMVVLR